MLCPECKKKAIVIDSRKCPTGEVYRRRVCKSCGHRFSTLECVVKFDNCTLRK
ncbi:MAG: hypothetical protein IKY91_00070 [Akkermansia sp.]|nr:hypothetical protein [Akkermansia sp.]